VCTSRKHREEEWCIEGKWPREHKRKKNRKRKGCAEDTDADRATQCSRTMIKPVSHWRNLYHYNKS
jgi:hypothetical protein